MKHLEAMQLLLILDLVCSTRGGAMMYVFNIDIFYRSKLLHNLDIIEVDRPMVKAVHSRLNVWVQAQVYALSFVFFIPFFSLKKEVQK